jgi:OOP family OmpA-OmpF porin
MKKQVLIVLIGTALAAPFAVQAEGFYVGGNIGRTNQKLNVDNFGSDKDSSTAYKFVGGYAFTKNIGAEVGYVAFGTGRAAIRNETYTAKPKAFYAAVTGTLPLNEQFSLTAKAGISVNRVKTTFSQPDFSQTDTSNETTALLGIGATYNFAPNLAAVFEYERFGKVAKDDVSNLKVNLLSAGLRYKF